MKKKFIIGCMTLMAVTAFCGCSADKSKTEEKTGDKVIVESKDDIDYDILYKVNNGSELLKKYDSVQYELTTITGEKDEEGQNVTTTEDLSLYKKDDDYVLVREDEKEIIVYMNNTCYYKNFSDEKNPKYSQGWFMDGVYEEFISNNVENFLINSESNEDFESIQEKDGKFVIWSYVGEDDDEKYYYRYTADKDTLELEKYEALIVKEVNGENAEEVVATGVVKLGEKIKEPEVVAEINNGEINIRRITVHEVDENGKVTDEFDIKISGNATLLTALKDGYGLYLSEDGEEAYDDSASTMNDDGVYPNNECYLIYKGE